MGYLYGNEWVRNSLMRPQFTKSFPFGARFCTFDNAVFLNQRHISHL